MWSALKDSVGCRIFKELASDLGLKYEQKGFFPYLEPYLSGIYRGREINLKVDTHNRPLAIIHVYHAGSPGYIEVKCRLLPFGRKKGLIFNDPYFDKHFLVKGDNEMMIRHIINADVRQLFIQGFQRYISPIKIANRYLTCECATYYPGRKEDITKEKGKLRSAVELLIDLANKIEKL